MTDKNAEEFLPLAPLSYQALISLADQANHGYGLMKDIAKRTGKKMNPATGTVYVMLQRLEDQGLVAARDSKNEAGGDSRRRNFSITQLGRQIAAAEARRLLDLVRQAESAMLIEPSS